MTAATDRPIDAIEVVDLDAMTTEELLRERVEVMTAIPMIDAQLRDKDRRPSSPEDDSSEWDAYRDWRRRARWALAHRKADLVTIKNILSERRDTATAERQRRINDGLPLSEYDRLGIERAERLNAALASQDAEGMLLRSYRIMRHLLQGYVNTLPDALDEEDRDALRMIGMHVRRRYGTGRIKAFVAGPDGACP